MYWPSLSVSPSLIIRPAGLFPSAQYFIPGLVWWLPIQAVPASLPWSYPPKKSSWGFHEKKEEGTPVFFHMLMSLPV